MAFLGPQRDPRQVIGTGATCICPEFSHERLPFLAMRKDAMDLASVARFQVYAETWPEWRYAL